MDEREPGGLSQTAARYVSKASYRGLRTGYAPVSASTMLHRSRRAHELSITDHPTAGCQISGRQRVDYDRGHNRAAGAPTSTHWVLGRLGARCRIYMRRSPNGYRVSANSSGLGHRFVLSSISGVRNQPTHDTRSGHTRVQLGGQHIRRRCRRANWHVSFEGRLALASSGRQTLSFGLARAGS